MARHGFVKRDAARSVVGRRERGGKRLKLTVEAPRRLMRYLAHCKIDIAGQLLEENLTYELLRVGLVLT